MEMLFLIVVIVSSFIDLNYHTFAGIGHLFLSSVKQLTTSLLLFALLF
jgi:hypothetical protein